MQPATKAIPVSIKELWTGRVLSTLVVLFLLFDAALHLMKPAPVVDAFAQLGLPLHLAVGLGILQLVCVILYAIPRTALPGAVLLTGYLGGAVAIQLRAGHSFFEIVFPVIVGALTWAGMFLRDVRLRALLRREF